MCSQLFFYVLLVVAFLVNASTSIETNQTKLVLRRRTVEETSVTAGRVVTVTHVEVERPGLDDTEHVELKEASLGQCLAEHCADDLRSCWDDAVCKSTFDCIRRCPSDDCSHNCVGRQPFNSNVFALTKAALQACSSFPESGMLRNVLALVDSRAYSVHDCFIAREHNLPGYQGVFMTLAEAKDECNSIPMCRGFTYETYNPTKDGLLQVFFKTSWNCQGTGWTAFRKMDEITAEQMEADPLGDIDDGPQASPQELHALAADAEADFDVHNCFITRGGEIEGYQGKMMDLSEARLACLALPECQGYSYKTFDPHKTGVAQVWLKAKWDCRGSGWTAFRKRTDMPQQPGARLPTPPTSSDAELSGKRSAASTRKGSESAPLLEVL